MTLNLANLDLLLARLETIPDDKFNMKEYYTLNGHSLDKTLHRGTIERRCGTAACVAGWIFEVATEIHPSEIEAAEWLGVGYEWREELFRPEGFNHPGRYTRQQAIAMLRYMRAEFLAIGRIVVDWAPPVTEPATSDQPPHLGA